MNADEIPILLFTAKQVAKMMGISRSQVYVLLNRGSLSSVSIGSSRRFTRGQVDDFISEHTVVARVKSE